MNRARLAPEIVDDFQRAGACVIRNALTRDEVALLERGIEKNLAAPGRLAAVASRSDDPGRFFEDFCNWQRIPEYESIMRHSALPRIAASLMQSETVRIYHDHLLVKEARTQQPTPWHQDQPYYNIDGRQNVSSGFRLIPCRANRRWNFLRDRTQASLLAQHAVHGSCRALSCRSKPNGFLKARSKNCPI